ncbi:unnamed protein product [Linum tenue]|uniref:Uncharacterized protein n=1 Tax=Linum tenue TaxID=586396 RepID=A0AAV0JR10_9ROSI|nr:unnamed protein product [Linum tenue]
MEALYPHFYMSSHHLLNDNSSSSSSQSSEWTKEENKAFESALALYGEHDPHRWLKVAAMIPGKSVSDVIKQYRELEEDVCEIEAGRVPIPGYLAADDDPAFSLDLIAGPDFVDSFRKRPMGSTKTSDQGRKKGVPWTEDEHRRFLKGLLKYGKGDWRNISRNFVVSKTPTQVASHAQKYFIRQQLSGVKDKRRPSIHDITTVNLSAVADNNNNNNHGALFSDGNKRPSSTPHIDHLLSPPPHKLAWMDWNHHHPNADLFMMGSSPYDQNLYAAAAARHTAAFQFSAARRIRS